MNQQALDFDAARARRDAGIASSTQHADDDAPGWCDRAFDLLCIYASQQPTPWTCETFRPWAYAQGLPVPAEERAWGGITQRALRRGVIERVGFAPTAASNGSPKGTYLARRAA